MFRILLLLVILLFLSGCLSIRRFIDEYPIQIIIGELVEKSDYSISTTGL